MPLVNLQKMLLQARNEKFAVGCFNAIDMQSSRAIISAAETETSPVIIAIAEVHLKYAPLNIILPLCINLAVNSSVPVAIILDHGKNYSTNTKAMQMGISAIMFDGSIHPFEENIERTKEMVKIAHSLDISVEAELGHVARPEGNPDKDETDLDDPIYTNPQDVLEFVSQTEVDALAVSFGTLHGLCDKAPKLNFHLLNRINEISPVPLVMHGASGLSDSDIKKSIKYGITKINYYSDIANSTAKYIQQKLNSNDDPSYFHDITSWGLEKMTELIRAKIRLFGSNLKA